MQTLSFDLVVIGAGPAGEVAAIRAAQLGLKVAVVEKRSDLGGTCLNVGCIPTKSLIESAKTWYKLQNVENVGFTTGKVSFDWGKILERKRQIVGAQRKGLLYLMRKNGIHLFNGHASFLSEEKIVVERSENTSDWHYPDQTDPKGESVVLRAQQTLVATGSQVLELPFAKSTGRFILNSDSILEIAEVPQSMAIIGGGVIGMEFASLFAMFGSEVTVIERLDQILPLEDIDCVAELTRFLRKLGVKILTGKTVSAITESAGGATVSIKGSSDETYERVLVAIGRKPVLEGLNLDKAHVVLDKKGFVKVDSHYRTSAQTIFAVGDVIQTPALAHTASAEGKHAAEIISGMFPRPINYESNPSAVYTYPEIASIGQTEANLKTKDIPYKEAKFPFAPLAKAKIERETEGFVKILYDPRYHEILGVHIVGARATEMISEFVLGKVLETTIDEISTAIHPHPTISETIMETAAIAEGGAIHL